MLIGPVTATRATIRTPTGNSRRPVDLSTTLNSALAVLQPDPADSPTTAAAVQQSYSVFIVKAGSNLQEDFSYMY